MPMCPCAHAPMHIPLGGAVHTCCAPVLRPPQHCCPVPKGAEREVKIEKKQRGASTLATSTMRCSLQPCTLPWRLTCRQGRVLQCGGGGGHHACAAGCAGPAPAGERPLAASPVVGTVHQLSTVCLPTWMALRHCLLAQVPGREVALLCQKVENLVVGAPCGIMDQASKGRHLSYAAHLPTKHG